MSLSMQAIVIDPATTDHPNLNFTDPARKKYLTALLQETNVDTATPAQLSEFESALRGCIATTLKLETRILKRTDAELVESFNYGGPVADAREEAAAAEARFVAYNLTFRAGMSARDQAIANALDEEKKVSDARRLVDCNEQAMAAEVKERNTAFWFKSCCFNLDAAIRVISAKVPGYTAEIIVPPPAKKLKPSPGEVQVTLAHAFKEPAGLEPIAFVSKLSAQLKACDTEEARLTKSTTARALKLASRPITKGERKWNNGVRKLERSVNVKDAADRQLAFWFQKHSVALKTKIADVAAGVVVV
jgi:hypothetical protein